MTDGRMMAEPEPHPSASRRGFIGGCAAAALAGTTEAGASAGAAFVSGMQSQCSGGPYVPRHAEHGTSEWLRA